MATTSNSIGLGSLLKCSDEKISVAVRFSSNQSYIANVGIKDTILDLKKAVALEANISPRNINLVLAGQLLTDSTLIQDCGLGSHTTLHAFFWSDDGLASGDVCLGTTHNDKKTLQTQPGPSMESSSLDTVHNNEISSGVLNHQEDVPQRRESDVDGDYLLRRSMQQTISSLGTQLSACTNIRNFSRFLVYCKLCESVQPGKLRLCCKQCGSGAFLVDRGPCNWNDISSDTSIRGTCKNLNCSCDIPRFYLRCCQHHEGDIDGTAVGLKHVQPNSRRVECIICSDVMSHVLIFPCSPGHVMCLDCFRQYGSTCLSERRFIEHPFHGYTLPCPVGCSDSHIEESHHFLLLGQEKYERYKNFGAEEYVLQNGGMLCPGPGCGTGLFPATDDRLIRCRECQFESCRECRREYHVGDCEEYLESLRLDLSNLEINNERALRASWERESTNLIEETTKTCPGCQTKTERSGGCMHLVCTRCRTEWCWVCVKPWNRDCQADHWFG
nr:E3 ubiquitin-protein ligase parkin-like [Biomphalaria glabrata]